MRCPKCDRYVKGGEDMRYHMRVVHGVMSYAELFLDDAWKAWEWVSKYGVAVTQ